MADPRTPETLLADAMTAYVLDSGLTQAPATGAPAFVVEWLADRGYEIRPLVDSTFRVGDQVAYDTGDGAWTGQVEGVDRNPSTSDVVALWINFGHSLIRVADPAHLARVRRVATLVPLTLEPTDA